jgi:hypothetical protein
MSVPYIGSQITVRSFILTLTGAQLISKSEIRYTGTLVEVNQAASTVTLQNGTPFPNNDIIIF